MKRLSITTQYCFIIYTYYKVCWCSITLLQSTVASSNSLDANCRIEKQSTLNVLVCDKFDTLDAFPEVSKQIAETVSHVSIKNQPRLKTIRTRDLKSFNNMLTFSLTDSGLNFMELFNGTKNVFESSSKTLSFVDLRHNAFKTLNWRWFVGFKSVTLDVNNNPLQCSCSLSWLANWYQLNQPKAFLTPLGKYFNLSTAKLVNFPQHIRDLDSLECRDSLSDKQVSLTEWSRTNNNLCSLPRVDIQPKIINTSPNENASFQCTVDTGEQTMEEKFFRATLTIDKAETNRKLILESIPVSSNVNRIRATITRVSMENMGWYVCVGKSDSGPGFDAAILVVSSEPRIKFIGASGEPGKDILFNFEIYGYPTANMTWLHNDNPISFKKSTPSELTYHTFNYTPTSVDRFYHQTQDFKVKILYNYPYYKGNYSLRACNEIGCDEILFAENINSSYFHEIRERPTNTPSVTQSVIVAENNSNILFVTIIVVCVSFGLTICSISIIYYLLKKRNYDKVSQRSRRDAKDLCALLGASEAFPLQNYSTNVIYQPVLSSDVPLIQRENVELIKEIGEGAFGKVYSAARINGPSNNEGEKTPVAVKFLKNVTTERCEEFAREAELMAKLDHPNIVTFYGVCLDNVDSNLLLLFEYMDLGDLKHFLATHGPNFELIGAAAGSEPLTEAQLISIATQVASGLNYLHKKHFVHRDLASRNCLCQSPLTIKLSDFGMSRDIYSNDYYRLNKKAPLPVRWLPPESLVYGKFTSHSDVWSYGVVLWEIFSYGTTPWCQYSNVEVLQQVTAGNVMEKPETCPDFLYSLMSSCWRKIPTERPSADQILQTLQNYQPS